VSERTEWVVVATFAQVYEAEIAKAILESAGIPAQVLGEHIGVFGPGWAGMAIRGVRLAVPGAMLDDANDVLNEDAYFEDDEDLELDDDDDDEDDDDGGEDENADEEANGDGDADGGERDGPEPWRKWGEWGPGAR
jgi:hypothetical protein